MGAHVMMTTRAGSNEFHGSAAGYLRNQVLDANDWFGNRGGQPRADFRMQDFSGTLGGPVLRNRTFFFFSQESLRVTHPAVEADLVPTAFSRLAAPPAAQWLLDALPLPNGPDVGGGLGMLTLTAPRASSLDSTSIRVDHTMGAKLRLFARYSHAPSHDSLTNSGSLLSTRVAVSSDSATAGLDLPFGRAANQSLRVNWTTIRETSSTWTQAFGRTVDLSQYLPALSDPAQTVYSLEILSPSIAMVSDSAAGSQRQWNLVDTTSVTHGSHTWAFGGDYRALVPGLSSKPFMATALYANLDSFAAQSPLEIAVAERNSVSLRLRNLSAFAQDTWRVSPRFVLNYGLRWEYNPAPGSHSGEPLFESVAPGNPPQIRFGSQGSSLWSVGWGGFAPRIGIVGRLDGDAKTVVRASAGLFYDPGFAAALEAAISQISTNISMTSAINGVNVTYSQVSTASPAAGSALAANFRMPYSLEWNASLERQVARRSVASVSWIGATDRRLLRLEQTQTADGDALAFYSNLGRSSYEALQAQWRSQLRPELEVVASFTWAHSIDNVSRDSDPFLWQPDWPGAIDRGNSTFDVRRGFSTAFTASPHGWRGWSLDGIFRARTGFPLTVTALDPRLAFGLESRPDLIAGKPVWIADSQAPGGRFLNPTAFAPSSLPLPGTLGRDAITGFGMWQLDAAVQREFRIRDRIGTQLRVEAFNVFNHPNFGNPDAFLSDPTFGRAGSMLNQFLGTGGPSTGLVPAFQIGGPRSIQVALRFRL